MAVVAVALLRVGQCQACVAHSSGDDANDKQAQAAEDEVEHDNAANGDGEELLWRGGGEERDGPVCEVVKGD